MNDADRLAAWRARQRTAFGRFDEPVEEVDEGLSDAESHLVLQMRAYVLGEERPGWIS